jgi:predicted dehydrogenase
MGDIGTHAAQLAEYISGLKITQLCADINIVVEGRKLDDDGNVLLKFNNGANGILVASQIACGEENSLKLRFTEKRRFGMASNGTQYSTG